MKKLILISALLCLVVLISGCKNEEVFDPFVNTDVTVWTPPKTSPPVKVTIPPAETENIEITTVPTETQKPKKKKKKKPTEVPTQGVVNPNGHIPVTTVLGDTTQEDLVFIWEKEQIFLYEPIEDVFTKIGEDNSSQEISDSEMAYEYEEFILYTFIDSKDVERLRKVELLTEDYTTAKGISCGDYASSLNKKYGNPVYQDSTTKHYGSKRKRIIFTHKNNIVTNISYEFFMEE